jgi:hypothetical protein
MMIGLLDEYIPVVKDSELNDDPLQPISRYAHDQIAEQGDKRRLTGCIATSVTPKSWLPPTCPWPISSVMQTRLRQLRYDYRIPTSV